MTASAPLHGIELIDCAKANARNGIKVAAQQCGYGEDHEQFLEAVQDACQSIGVDVNELRDLISEQRKLKTNQGIEISPDSPADL